MHGGIDEAGRGPVFGPLVVAGVAVPELHPLRELGVRDSKRLAPRQRERLARLIRDLPGAVVVVEAVEASRIDALRATQSLNGIETTLFARVAERLESREVVVDAADVDAARFGRHVAAAMAAPCRIVSEHGADDRHPAVAAASIVAKVERDGAVADLARRLERRLAMPLGSGYPGDARTQAFLSAYVQAHGELPDGCRRSWQTAKAVAAAARTRRLDTFGGA